MEAKKKTPPPGITVVVLDEPYEKNMTGDICGLPTKVANALVNMGKARLYAAGAELVPEDYSKLELADLRNRCIAAGIDLESIASRVPAKDQGRFRQALIEALKLHDEGLRSKAA